MAKNKDESGGAALQIGHGEYVVISDNVFEGFPAGMEMEVGRNVVFERNVMRNVGDGVRIREGEGITIRNNDIEASYHAVILDKIRVLTMTGNRFASPDAQEAIQHGDVKRLLDLLNLPANTDLKMLSEVLEKVSRKPANPYATWRIVSRSRLREALGQAADWAQITALILQLHQMGLIPAVLAHISRVLLS